MSENDEVYDVARKELDALVSDMTINAATIMQLLKISMEITEATQLKGEEQRKLCIKLVIHCFIVRNSHRYTFSQKSWRVIQRFWIR